MKSTWPSACLLGKNWGYDNAGVWVADGCGGEFQLGQGAAAAAAEPPAYVPVETWREFEPGQGFLVGRSDAGELEISAYARVRYVNQMPGTQTFTDHLGVEHTVNGRNDLFPHRIMVPIPKKLEAYAATSQILGDTSAGFVRAMNTSAARTSTRSIRATTV